MRSFWGFKYLNPVPLYSWEDELSKCSAGTVCDHRNWAETYSAQLRSYPCQLDWGIQTLKKGAKFKLFKIFQFYLRFSSLLISRSYLIPTVPSFNNLEVYEKVNKCRFRAFCLLLDTQKLHLLLVSMSLPINHLP